jgi:hypothetical protein
MQYFAVPGGWHLAAKPFLFWLFFCLAWLPPSVSLLSIIRTTKV